MAHTEVVIFLMVGVVYCLARTGLRWDVKESDGRLVRSLSDGQEIITLEYNNREELVQCWKGRKGKDSDSISLMFYSAMSDVTAVRKDAIEIDMKQIKRDCKTYMQWVELAENMTAIREEVDNINTLRETVDGTKWCGLYEGKPEKKALKREDRCCKKWHNCPVQIQGYNYEYMMYNYRPHKLVACSCTLELEACLRNITMSSLAEDVLQVMFGEEENSYTPVCLHTERRKDNCVQWDKFYHKCLKYEWANYGAVKTLKAYRDGISMLNVTLTPEGNNSPTSDGAKTPILEETSTLTSKEADMPTSEGADTPTSDRVNTPTLKAKNDTPKIKKQKKDSKTEL